MIPIFIFTVKNENDTVIDMNKNNAWASTQTAKIIFLVHSFTGLISVVF